MKVNIEKELSWPLKHFIVSSEFTEAQISSAVGD